MVYLVVSTWSGLVVALVTAQCFEEDICYSSYRLGVRAVFDEEVVVHGAC